MKTPSILFGKVKNRVGKIDFEADWIFERNISQQMQRSATITEEKKLKSVIVAS